MQLGYKYWEIHTTTTLEVFEHDQGVLEQTIKSNKNQKENQKISSSPQKNTCDKLDQEKSWSQSYTFFALSRTIFSLNKHSHKFST